MYAEAGWQGMTHPVEYGGQGLPGLIGSPCSEMLNAANLSFALCPLLTNGAIEALLTAGSPELKQRFIEPMISGRWTGTMNLTEPQAGSDLAMVRSRAQSVGDGTYRISGTKIFITYGEHDLAENILHLVLARLPDAPEGVKGISLFLVPKFLVNEDGTLGARNDVHCVSIEHKLGIKASPTCTPRLATSMDISVHQPLTIGTRYSCTARWRLRASASGLACARSAWPAV
jgi:alkylation response protein AidB-like acyl-CoA dehydrogenase